MSKGSKDRVRKREQFKKNHVTVYDHARQLRPSRPGKTTYVWDSEKNELVPRGETASYFIGVDMASGEDMTSFVKKCQDGVFKMMGVPEELLGLKGETLMMEDREHAREAVLSASLVPQKDHKS